MTFPVTGAKGILLNVTTGPEILLTEMSDAAAIIEETADIDAQVIWGHVIDENLGEKVHVTLIATFPEDAMQNLPKTAVRPIKTKEPPVPQQPVQPAQSQQPQGQYSRPGGTIYDIFNKNRDMAKQGLQEANLTTPTNEGAFPASQRKLYDQPAIYRKNRKN